MTNVPLQLNLSSLKVGLQRFPSITHLIKKVQDSSFIRREAVVYGMERTSTGYCRVFFTNRADIFVFKSRSIYIDSKVAFYELLFYDTGLRRLFQEDRNYIQRLTELPVALQAKKIDKK